MAELLDDEFPEQQTQVPKKLNGNDVHIFPGVNRQPTSIIVIGESGKTKSGHFTRGAAFFEAKEGLEIKIKDKLYETKGGELMMMYMVFSIG